MARRVADAVRYAAQDCTARGGDSMSRRNNCCCTSSDAARLPRIRQAARNTVGPYWRARAETSSVAADVTVAISGRARESGVCTLSPPVWVQTYDERCGAILRHKQKGVGRPDPFAGKWGQTP